LFGIYLPEFSGSLNAVLQFILKKILAFEFLTAVSVKIRVLLDVMPCSVVDDLGVAVSVFGYKNEVISSLKMMTHRALSYVRQLQSE